MQVARGLEMLEIRANLMGETSVIHPALIWDEDTAVLVDAGFPGQLPQFREAMEAAGVPVENLGKVVLTHQDIDHIGCLPDLLKASTQKVEVLSSELEKPYIQGEKPLIKLEKAMAGSNDLPQELHAGLKRVFENPPKAPVDKTVADGEELPFCGGITVIHTPGHTPGHICLYHQQSKTLIAGDALAVVDGQLVGPVPQYTLDMDVAIQSLKKLMQYDIEAVICYHGGLYRGHVNRRIAELANG
ncbi:MBL fold metallo-hydrolase [Polycladomyces sp. WAk]|uniref:MBL fold metallo-hydrolase n=1 Tax=Polycladomyces zharkentensis TaxID=2807616 RepID=A0ABS2WKW9_9BACL|nr:MBL fold metallo-hydrolase [Polycladomyces sp. WAk]MBN2910118.1 MBL fold metallo-hydrolase [Polycladomyces sp. WAk]